MIKNQSRKCLKLELIFCSANHKVERYSRELKRKEIRKLKSAEKFECSLRRTSLSFLLKCTRNKLTRIYDATTVKCFLESSKIEELYSIRRQALENL